jgi:DNA adenine methylase
MTSPNAKSVDRIQTASTIVGSGESSDRTHRRNGRERPTSSHLSIVAINADSEDVPSSTSGNHRRLGSKANAGVFHTIINQMPPHRCYIEPFLGWATIMKAKLPADRNIGIDRNGDTIAQARLDLPSAELSVGDGIRFLERFQWHGGELVYADPPYLLETRTSNSRYTFELSDHARLLDVLCRLPCPVILSGYYSTLYAERLSDWRVITYTGQTRGGPRTEYLWCNFPEPLELHDYRYLGNGFRERERIKKMQRRWVKKLSGLPSLERHALFSAMREVQEQHGRAVL